MKYTDPTGHGAYCGDDYDPGCLDDDELEVYENHITENIPEQSLFDTDLGGNNAGEFQESNNDDLNLLGMVAAGVVLTGGIIVAEALLFEAEVAMVPVVSSAPIVGVPMEAVLIGASLFLIDVDVAYWSYVYRTYQASVKQEFKWFYPWGLPAD